MPQTAVVQRLGIIQCRVPVTKFDSESISLEHMLALLAALSREVLVHTKQGTDAAGGGDGTSMPDW